MQISKKSAACLVQEAFLENIRRTCMKNFKSIAPMAWRREPFEVRTLCYSAPTWWIGIKFLEQHLMLCGPGGFFVEHMELDLCVKFQVNPTYGVRGMAFPKTHIQALITAPPSGRFGSYFNKSWCISFPIIEPSFKFVVHSSSREFQLKRQTTKNNNNKPAQFQNRTPSGLEP